MPSPQSSLLTSMQEAITASRLSDLELEALTEGAVSYVTVWRIRHGKTTPDLSKVRELARALSQKRRVLDYWKTHAHPTGEACVSYWTTLYKQAKGKQSNPSTDQRAKVSNTTVFCAMSEYCD